MRFHFKAPLIAASLAASMAATAQQPQSTAPSGAATYPAYADCAMMKGSYGKRAMQRPAMTAEQRMARFDSMTAQQAQALQITAAQRPQWDAYVQAKKNFFAGKRQNMPSQEFARMTADERADLRARHLETAAQHARQVASSTRALRETLTPEQRTRFDQMGMHHGARQTAKHRRSQRRSRMAQDAGTPHNQQPPASMPAPIKR